MTYYTPTPKTGAMKTRHAGECHGSAEANFLLNRRGPAGVAADALHLCPKASGVLYLPDKYRTPTVLEINVKMEMSAPLL